MNDFTGDITDMNLLETLSGPTLTLLYVGFYVILLIAVIINSYEKNLSFKNNMDTIWKMRSVYSTILVQIFDQASDIGVLLVWWEYTVDEQSHQIDVPHIDMQLLTYLSLASLVLSRVISAVVVMLTIEHQNCMFCMFDAILCLLELYTINQVLIIHSTHKSNKGNQAHGDNDNATRNTKSKNNQIEPTTEMQTVQWIESLFESFPQILLQLVFIIRTFDSEFETITENRLFFQFSLLWSMISTSGKFISMDKRDYVFSVSTHHLHLCKKVKQNI